MSIINTLAFNAVIRFGFARIFMPTQMTKYSEMSRIRRQPSLNLLRSSTLHAGESDLLFILFGSQKAKRKVLEKIISGSFLLLRVYAAEAVASRDDRPGGQFSKIELRNVMRSVDRQLEHLVEIAIVQFAIPTDRNRIAAHDAIHCGRIKSLHQLLHVFFVIARSE
jgi:hypothetical protein